LLGQADPVPIEEARTLLAPLANVPALLLAVSGGPDSVALMRLAAAVFRPGEGGPRLSAATIDHGLREEGATEAAAVGAWAAELGIAHATLEWRGPKPSTGLQEQAREARYGLLHAHAKALGIIDFATAHHADDQAETVLMRLAAGSGPAGLAGMRTRSQRAGLVHWRPLLGVPKERLLATLVAAGQAWFEDPGNCDGRFARGRLRAMQPLLAAEGLDRERLLRLAEREARADDALSAMAAAAWARHVRVFDAGLSLAPEALREPREIFIRLLAAMLGRVNMEGRMPRLKRVERLAGDLESAGRAHGSAAGTLGGCRVAIDADGRVSVTPEGERHRGMR
jgi:tRNA(Ile)-lysidine synthase